jgi:hypothetical protein
MVFVDQCMLEMSSYRDMDDANEVRIVATV